MTRAKVWGIPCPDHGDDYTRKYALWFALYKANQRVRHIFFLHQKQSQYSIAPRCDWCGHRSKKQRMIASRNAAWLDDGINVNTHNKENNGNAGIQA